MSKQTIKINLEDGKIVDAYLKSENDTIPLDMDSLIDLIVKANKAEHITVIKEDGKITKWRKKVE